MNLQWNDRHTRQFITNVGLIPSDAHFGPDVMAADTYLGNELIL